MEMEQKKSKNHKIQEIGEREKEAKPRGEKKVVEYNDIIIFAFGFVLMKFKNYNWLVYSADTAFSCWWFGIVLSLPYEVCEQ